MTYCRIVCFVRSSDVHAYFTDKHNYEGQRKAEGVHQHTQADGH